MSNNQSSGAEVVVPIEVIERRIYLIRGQKVMLSSDLAELYQVETRALVQAVKRNIERFPDDFMFQLSREEWANLKSQSVTSSWGGARREAPYAFTQHGVAMLASVLRSPTAVQVNILIVRAFIRLRELIASHQDLAARIEALEANHERHASVLALLAEEIDKLNEEPPEPTKGPMGFRP